MRAEGLKRGLVSISLVFALALSITFLATPVLAEAVISEPGGTTENVDPGQEFVLSFRFEWDEPENGRFAIALKWVSPENNPAENFTIVGVSAYFDNGQPIVAKVTKEFERPEDSGTLYNRVIGTPVGDPNNGPFNVDITFLAGSEGVAHIPGTHTIEIDGSILVAEGLPWLDYYPPDPVITVRIPGPGVDVSISPPENSGPLGATLEYIVTVKNTGTVKDNYTLTPSDDAGWSLSLSKNRFENVLPGENRTAMLNVTIPGDAVPSTEDNITVTVTSDAGASDSDVCIAHAEEVRHGVEVSISPSYQSAPIGMTPSYTVIVRNTGNVMDNYTLSVDDNAVPSWGPTLLDNLVNNRLENVRPGESRMVTLSVTIPPDVAPSTEDNITVTATSEGDPSEKDNASTIAHAIEREVEIKISPNWQRGGPDDNIWGEYDLKYTVTVTNMSAKPDNYYLDARENLGWGLWLPGFLLEVPPGENKNATLFVQVPEDAEPGTEDTIIVTVTSFDGELADYASCVAQSGVVAFEVLISPSRKSGIYLYDLEYLVWITNKGTLPDSYTVTVTDTLDWDLGLEFPSGIVPAGENENAKLYVGVPWDVEPGTEDEITVVVTSRTDNTISDNAVCIARAARVDMKVTISPSYQMGSPGEALVYLLTVRNDGDIHTTYFLSADDNAGWWPTLDDNKLAIPSGESATTKLRVRVPDDATHRTMDNLTVLVSAAAQAVGTVEREVSSIAQAETFRLFISPGVDSARPGENLTFAVWVTNVGIENDNYDLTVSDDAGWGLSLSESSLEDVTPGESRRATLTVTIPEDAEPGTEDNVNITVIPKAGPASSESENIVAIAAPSRGVRVSISPKDQAGSGGSTISYVVIVHNVGTENDNYDLTVSDEAGWIDNITLSENLLGVPGLERRGTILEVTIPREAEAGTVDNVLITVTSRADNTVSASASCAAQMEIPAWIKRAIVRGDDKTYNLDAVQTVEQGDDPPEVWYSPGDYPPLMVAKRVENGAVVAAGFVSTSRDGRWNPPSGPGVATSKFDVLLDMAFRWMIPDNRAPIKVLWYGEYKVGVELDNENYYVENGVYNDAGRTGLLNQALADRGYVMEHTMDGEVTRITPSLLENYDILIIPELQLGGRWSNGGDPTLLPDADVEAIENFVKRGGGLLIMEGTDYFGFNFYRIQNKILRGLGIEDIYFQSDQVNQNDSYAFNAVVTDIDFGENYRRVTGLTHVWAYSTSSLVIKPEKKELDVSMKFITSSYLEGLPKETLTYTLSITNTGKLGNTYILNVVDNAGFSLSVFPSTLALAPGASDNVTLSVTIPDDTPRGTESGIAITVNSVSDPTLGDVAHAKAWTGALGVSASIDPTFRSGEPGENLKFIIYVKNTGDFDDNYTLSVSDTAGWAPTLSWDNLDIPKGRTKFAVLSVVIPEDVAAGAEDNITVTVTSQTDNRVSTENSAMAQVAILQGVDVLISPASKTGAPGEEINFSVTITNTGTGTDTFSLVASDTEGWGPTLAIMSATLAGGASRPNIELSITIPEDAADGDSTLITVTATSQTDPGISDSDTSVAQAAIVGKVEVSISPENRSGPPGENLTFTVVVTNAGEAEDIYDLTVSDDAGWGAVLSDDLLTVPAGENRTITLSIVVPSDAVVGESTSITVTATSRDDPAVRDTATGTAAARERPPGLLVPIGVGGAAIGGGIVLTLMLKKGMISLSFLRPRPRRLLSGMGLGRRPPKRSLLAPRPFRPRSARARKFPRKWL
jgi:uncharacterized membrane protein